MFRTVGLDCARLANLLLLAGLLASCGGGGGGGSSTVASSNLLGPSAQYAQQCDPSNPVAPAANKTSSLGTEKQWIRSYVNEAYLWYNQVPTVDALAASYSGPMSSLNAYNVPTPLDSYFRALKTPQITATGTLVDKFSFAYATADWNALSQSGQSAGYGANVALLATTVPRKAVVAYTDPNTPAALAQPPVTRGAQILALDGVDLVNDNTQAGVAILNKALFPNVNEAHLFTLLDAGSSTTRTVTLTTQIITSTPVQNVKTIPGANSSTVGYMLFNAHLASAEPLLVNGINQLKTAGVSDLVLDLRYNGGGYLYVASQLAYMIAGPSSTTNKIFEKLQYNDKRTADTNSPSSSTPFRNVTCNLNGNACTSSNPLPYLGLNTVYVLTQGGTCSASESIINALRGVGLTVRLIGNTTCGKPYGFTAKDNCGVSYFPIEFKGTNQVGFGDYSDGFSANCSANDDFSKPLGDPSEGQLAAALTLRSTGLCPGGTAIKPQVALEAAKPSPSYILLRNALLENRWLLPQR